MGKALSPFADAAARVRRLSESESDVCLSAPRPSSRSILRASGPGLSAVEVCIQCPVKLMEQRNKVRSKFRARIV